MKKLSNIEDELKKSVAKLMTQFLNKFKKSYFDPFFGYSEGNFSFKTPALSPTTRFEFLTPFQHLTKNDDPIPKKLPERWTKGQSDRP